MAGPMTDAAPVRAHLEKLLQYTSRVGIEKGTGVSTTTQRRILNGTNRQVSVRIAQTILSYSPGDRRLGQPQITARESIDEFLHLYRLGVSVWFAAKRTGLSPTSLPALFSRVGLPTPEGVHEEERRARRARDNMEVAS